MRLNQCLKIYIQIPLPILNWLMLAALMFEVPPARAQEKQTSATHMATTAWPIPSETHQLFYLQRDPDINTVVYRVNLVDGKLDTDNPVDIFWIRYAENNERKPLNYIQRTMAFGMTHAILDDGDIELQLVSYKTLPLRLSFDKKKGKHVVYTRISGTQALLDRIYVRIDGGSTFNPNIEYFELFGRQLSSGKAISERISP